MSLPFRIIDGSKAAQFDGLFLEVSGINGSADSKRIGIQVVENVGVAQAGEEWLFMVKAKNGGFSVVISAEKKDAWEQLGTAVTEAKNQLT